MKKLFILLIGVWMVTISCFSQPIDSIKTKIVGKWILTKHTLLEKGKLVNKFNAQEGKIIFEFKDDGTYVNTSADTLNSIVTVGKWKISTNKKNIDTYENKFLPPHDKDGICANHPLRIIKLTASEFITNEYFYSESAAGTSYYKKIK